MSWEHISGLSQLRHQKNENLCLHFEPITQHPNHPTCCIGKPFGIAHTHQRSVSQDLKEIECNPKREKAVCKDVYQLAGHFAFRV